MAPRESFGELLPERVRDRKGGGDGGKFEWKSSEVNTRIVSRVQNKLIGEFKMAESDVISVKG